MKVAERWFVMAGIGLLGAIALAGLVVAVYAAWLFHDLPDASDLADYRPPTATRVYAGDGTLIGEFSDERRIYVSFDQIPTTVVQAFLAAEDRNFFQHGGIDVGGIGRAMFKNLFNVVSGRRLEGGSTITQQVAKNLFLWSGRSVIRKGLELPLALWIDFVLPKQRILEIYLNIAEMGPAGQFGAEAGAQYAFGRSAAALSPREAALLAAILPNPLKRSARNPGPGVRRLSGTYMARANTVTRCWRDNRGD